MMPGTVRDWLNFWRNNFKGHVVGGSLSSSAFPSSADIVNGFNKNQIYSVAIHESTFPAGYDHNVLIQSVEQHVKSGKYRYVLMDPNGVRSITAKRFELIHRRHIIIQK